MSLSSSRASRKRLKSRTADVLTLLFVAHHFSFSTHPPLPLSFGSSAGDGGMPFWERRELPLGRYQGDGHDDYHRRRRTTITRRCTASNRRRRPAAFSLSREHFSLMLLGCHEHYTISLPLPLDCQQKWWPAAQTQPSGLARDGCHHIVRVSESISGSPNCRVS